MASFFYDSFWNDLFSGAVAPEADTTYMMLATSSYTPNKSTNAKRSDVTNESSGAGYTTGGQSVTTTITNASSGTSDLLDRGFADVSWTTATITAAYAVVYKHRGGASSADNLYCLIDFGGTFSSVAVYLHRPHVDPIWPAKLTSSAAASSKAPGSYEFRGFRLSLSKKRMILLTSIGDLVELTCGASVASIDIHCSYVDINGSTITPGRTNTIITSSTALTTIVGSPASSTQRNVKFISVNNTSATSCQVKVQHTDGSNVITLCNPILQPSYTLFYNDLAGWGQMDNNWGYPRHAPARPTSQHHTPDNNHVCKLHHRRFDQHHQSQNGRRRGRRRGVQHLKLYSLCRRRGRCRRLRRGAFLCLPNTAYAYQCGAAGSGVSASTGGWVRTPHSQGQARSPSRLWVALEASQARPPLPCCLWQEEREALCPQTAPWMAQGFLETLGSFCLQPSSHQVRGALQSSAVEAWGSLRLLLA